MCDHVWELVNHRELTCPEDLSHRAFDRRKVCTLCQEMKYLSSKCLDCTAEEKPVKRLLRISE